MRNVEVDDDENMQLKRDSMTLVTTIANEDHLTRCFYYIKEKEKARSSSQEIISQLLTR